VALPASGVEIALLDWGGTGPLALLHHANGFCGAMWGLVAEALQPHFRVVAMDARGHGDSSRPREEGAYDWNRFPEDILGVARVLAPEAPGARVALGLGHSFGGTSMLAAAAGAPGLFGRIVAVDPVIVPPSALAAPSERRPSLAEGARRRRGLFASRAEARSKWKGRDFFARWDARALDLYVEEGLRDRADGKVELKCAPEVEAAIFEATGVFDIFEKVASLSAPALLLWAARGSFSRSVYESLVERMPHGRVETVDAGHLVPMEQPRLVSDAVLRFTSESL
jgi:pimeloyl-ACP methyl ester carboxylesterase